MRCFPWVSMTLNLNESHCHVERSETSQRGYGEDSARYDEMLPVGQHDTVFY
jgi:hypothetical protein